MPPGSVRYWSWLFAAQEARPPLLGMYALMAEWRALMDPGTDASVAQIKLTWWRDEVRRLAAGSPLHPITRYIAALPHLSAAEPARLDRTIEAATAQVAGAPLELAAELGTHATALYGVPLQVAARLAGPHGASRGVNDCTAALAAADYLSRAVADYRREARSGRVVFPVDELLAAGIDNDDLAADVPPPPLRDYLQDLRQRATGHFSSAAAALEPAARPALRHLAVLATLGAGHLSARRDPSDSDFRFTDLYNAWNAARRAMSAR